MNNKISRAIADHFGVRRGGWSDFNSPEQALSEEVVFAAVAKGKAIRVSVKGVMTDNVTATFIIANNHIALFHHGHYAVLGRDKAGEVGELVNFSGGPILSQIGGKPAGYIIAQVESIMNVCAAIGKPFAYDMMNRA